MSCAETPPLRRRDGEEVPFSGQALELVRAAVVEGKETVSPGKS